MTELTESRRFEELYVSDVRVISGIRPIGRTVDHTADGRHDSGLLFIWNGETTFREKNRTTVARQGDLVFIPKGRKYKMEYSADGTTFVLVNFNTFLHTGEGVLLRDGIKLVARDDGENGVARIMTSFELCSVSMDAHAIFRRRELLYRLLGICYGAGKETEALTVIVITIEVGAQEILLVVYEIPGHTGTLRTE